MLTECPECRLQISDKAITCPHCGYPLVSDIKRAYTKPTKRAHRKLPNGFGSITEIKGRYLRNPFLARVCIGKTETGRPILHNLKPKAYFKTYNEAYAALVEYHRSPVDKMKSITMEELYKKWSPTYFEQISTSSARAVIASWKKCSSIYKVNVQNINAGILRELIDQEPSANMKQRMKSMFNMMLDYAMEYEIINRNVSKTFKLSKNIINEIKEVKNPHESLTLDEISMLWSKKDDPYVTIILVGCYTGMRPQELLDIKCENINKDEMYLTGGSKTNAGKNRIIPIHEKIKEMIFSRLGESKWLFTNNGIKVRYEYFRKAVENILPNHRPHDFRKTFVTYANKCGMDPEAIKRIVGHQLDVTEGVYTDRSIEWLRNEMNKLVYK